MIFDLPIYYHVQQFLPYNVRLLGVILDLHTYLLTLKSDVNNGRSLRQFFGHLQNLGYGKNTETANNATSKDCSVKLN